MKILMATMSLGIGGAETHIVELAKELSARGHEVMIASGGGVFVGELEKLGIKHYDVPMNRRSAGLMLKSLLALRKIIKAEKPQIVHAHARIPGFLCGILHRFGGFHFVTTDHGVFDTGGVLTLLTNWGEKTVAVSDDIRRYLMENYSVADCDIFTTINGIDGSVFSPDRTGESVRREFGIPEGAFVIGHVSRLDSASSDAAEALIELSDRIEKRIEGAVILIAGGGERFEELRGKAEEANARIGRKCVILTGARTDICDVTALSKLFVGVSRAALEAMSEEKPVILAGAQGHTGIFTPENCALAVSTNFCCRGDKPIDADRLFDEIERVYEMTAEERSALGRFGREIVLRDYSTKRMADDTLRAYSAALNAKRITMSGYYGFGNAGDEAVLKSVLASGRKVFPDAEITVLSSSPETTKRLYGCRTVKRFRPLEVFRAIRGCDLFISGGGSLLQDATSTRSLVYYVLLIRLAKLLGKKVMLYANGIGPVTKNANRRRVRRAVMLADSVTLRDRASLDELRSMGVTRDDIAVTADPVFLLSPDKSEVGREILDRAGVPEGSFAAVSVRPWKNDEDFRSGMAFVCDGIAKKLGWRIVFVPMQPGVDERESEAVAALMEERAYVLPAEYSAEELMSVISLAELTLSMRLHSLLFAARAGVPSVGFSYDPKLDAYLELLGEPNAGSVGSFDAKAALEVCLAAAEEREIAAAELAKKRDGLIEAAGNNEDYLRAVL